MAQGRLAVVLKVVTCIRPHAAKKGEAVRYIDRQTITFVCHDEEDETIIRQKMAEAIKRFTDGDP